MKYNIFGVYMLKNFRSIPEFWSSYMVFMFMCNCDQEDQSQMTILKHFSQR